MSWESVQGQPVSAASVIAEPDFDRLACTSRTACMRLSILFQLTVPSASTLPQHCRPGQRAPRTCRILHASSATSQSRCAQQYRFELAPAILQSCKRLPAALVTASRGSDDGLSLQRQEQSTMLANNDIRLRCKTREHSGDDGSLDEQTVVPFSSEQSRSRQAKVFSLLTPV